MPLPAYFNHQQQQERLKLLGELFPDRLAAGSALFSSEPGNNNGQPQTDYFASLPFLPSRSQIEEQQRQQRLQTRQRATSSAGSSVPGTRAPGSSHSFQGLSQPPPTSNLDTFYQGQEDDQASVADTLSEWGLDHLFQSSAAAGPDGRSSRARTTSGTSSLAASLALYKQKSSTSGGLPSDHEAASAGIWPEGEGHEDEEADDDDNDDAASVQVQAVNFDGRDTGRPRVRKISTTSQLTMQSSTGFSRPVTPVSAPPSRPASALSRFDPGPTTFESAQEYAERKDSARMRPRLYIEGDHRPKTLVMPEPLATAEDQEREQEREEEQRRLVQSEQQTGDVCSIPSLRSSDDEEDDHAGSDEEGGEGGSAQEAKTKQIDSENLEELAVSRIPAGKLYGRSLMDEMVQRQANLKNKSRAYGGYEGRMKMMEVPGPSPAGGNRRIEDIEPWNRFSVANFQTLMQQSSDRSHTLAPGPHHQNGLRPGMPQTRSVFGVDKVMEAELAKLEKILKIEEAEKKMEAERKRVQELERQAQDAHKAEKERIRAEKKRKWKKSRMLDDVMLSDDASLRSDPSLVAGPSSAVAAAAADQHHDATEAIDEDPEDHEHAPMPRERRHSVAPSLTLSHLDLNNLESGEGLGSFLKPKTKPPGGDSSDEDDDPWAVSRNPDRPSKDFEMPDSAQVWKQSTRNGTATPLPKFAFDQDESESDEEESEQLKAAHDDDEDDDEKPLRRVLDRGQRSSQAKRPQATAFSNRPQTRMRSKSDVGSLLGLGPDLFQSSSKTHSKDSDEDDSSSSSNSERSLEAEAVRPPPPPSSLGFGARSRGSKAEQGSDDDEDDKPLGRPMPAAGSQTQRLPNSQSLDEDEDDVPLGQRRAPAADADSEEEEDRPLGATHALAYQQQQQQQQQQQAAAYYMAAQQQQAQYNMALQQQQMMFMYQQQQQQQWMMQQQQQQMQQQQAEGSILGAAAYPGNDKLLRRVDDWRAGVE